MASSSFAKAWMPSDICLSFASFAIINGTGIPRMILAPPVQARIRERYDMGRTERKWFRSCQSAGPDCPQRVTLFVAKRRPSLLDNGVMRYRFKPYEFNSRFAWPSRFGVHPPAAPSAVSISARVSVGANCRMKSTVYDRR